MLLNLWNVLRIVIELSKQIVSDWMLFLKLALLCDGNSKIECFSSVTISKEYIISSDLFIQNPCVLFVLLSLDKVQELYLLSFVLWNNLTKKRCTKKEVASYSGIRWQEPTEVGLVTLYLCSEFYILNRKLV